MDQRLSNVAGRSAASARLPVCIGLADLITLGLALPARAEMENKTARPGQQILLHSFATWQIADGCPSSPVPIELVSPPQGGRVEQRRELRIVMTRLDASGNTVPADDACVSVKKDVLSLYYTARSDFSGVDTVSVVATYPNSGAVPFVFRITVPEGERRRAPAISEAPDPGERGVGQAAKVEGAAPSSRGASTSDFLRDTVRQSVPAARPAAAPPPRMTGQAEAPAAARGTEPVAPRVLAPQPQPSAQPQL